MQRTNLREKNSKETKENSSQFFHAAGHLNKNINSGASRAERQDNEMKNKTGD